jgi:hypothetical protein
VSCTFCFESFPELQIVWERWKCCDWMKWKKFSIQLGFWQSRNPVHNVKG